MHLVNVHVGSGSAFFGKIIVKVWRLLLFKNQMEF